MFLFGVGGRMLNLFNSKIWGPSLTQNDKEHLCDSATVREYCISWPLKYEDEFGNLAQIAVQYCSKDAKDAIKKYNAYWKKQNSSENRSVVLSGMVDLSTLKPKVKSSRQVICLTTN
jgi:hypothetical protein